MSWNRDSRGLRLGAWLLDISERRHQAPHPWTGNFRAIRLGADSESPLAK